MIKSVRFADIIPLNLVELSWNFILSKTNISPQIMSLPDLNLLIEYGNSLRTEVATSTLIAELANRALHMELLCEMATNLNEQ